MCLTDVSTERVGVIALHSSNIFISCIFLSDPCKFSSWWTVSSSSQACPLWQAPLHQLFQAVKYPFEVGKKACSTEGESERGSTLDPRLSTKTIREWNELKWRHKNTIEYNRIHKRGPPRLTLFASPSLKVLTGWLQRCIQPQSGWRVAQGEATRLEGTGKSVQSVQSYFLKYFLKEQQMIPKTLLKLKCLHVPREIIL